MSRTLSICVVLSFLALGPVSCTQQRAAAPRRTNNVRVAQIHGDLPGHDPFAPAWDEASEFEGTLAPQNVTQPMLATPGVNRVRVRALHNGTWIAFRLEWDDRTKDDLLGSGRFSDAAAIQFPSAAGALPSPMMGHPGGPVTIAYWKAAWQVPDQLDALYPNRPPGYYPYQSAQGDARAPMEALYGPARNVHNPLLERPDGAPVALAQAEGFGSLTSVRDYRSDGVGVHRDGHWYTVLSFPMGAGGVASLSPGHANNVAFAVWEGTAQNVGSRKMRSEAWVALVFERSGS